MAGQTTKTLKINITVDAKQAKAEAANLRSELLGVFQNLRIPTFERLVTQLRTFADAARVSRQVMEGLHRTMAKPMRLQVTYSAAGAGFPRTARELARLGSTVPTTRTRMPREMSVTDYSNVLGRQLGTHVKPEELVTRLKNLGVSVGKTAGGKFGALSAETFVPTAQLKEAGAAIKKELAAAKVAAKESNVAAVVQTAKTQTEKVVKATTERAVKEIQSMRVYDYAKQLSTKTGTKVTSEEMAKQLSTMGVQGAGGGPVAFGSVVQVDALKRAGSALLKEMKPIQKAAASMGIPPEVIKSYDIAPGYLKRITASFERLKTAQAESGVGKVNEFIKSVNAKEAGAPRQISGFKASDIGVLQGAPMPALADTITQAMGINLGSIKKYTNELRQAAKQLNLDVGDLANMGIPAEDLNRFVGAWKEINANIDPYAKALDKAQAGMKGLKEGTDAYHKQQKLVNAAQKDFDNAVKSTGKTIKDMGSGIITKQAGQGKLMGEAEISARSVTDMRELGKMYPQLAAGANKYKIATEGAHNMFSKLVTSAGNFIRFQMPWFLGASAIFTVIGALTSLGKAMFEYKQNLADIQAITMKSSEEMEVYGRTIQKISTETSLSTGEIGKIGLQLIRAGIEDIGEASKATEIAAKVAVVSGEDVKVVANTIATAYFAWGMRAKDMIKVGNTLAATLNFSRLQVEDLGVAYNYLAGTASLMNRSFEETNAIMAVLSNMGVKASTIGTGLSFVFARLITPTKTMSDYFSTLGITMSEVDIKTHDFATVLENLAKKGFDASLSMELFGQRAGRTMMFLAQAGPESIRTMQKRIEESSQLTKGLEIAMAGPIKQIQQLWNTMQVAAVQIGGALVPVLQGLIWVLKQLANVMAGGLDWWISWHGLAIGTTVAIIWLRKEIGSLITMLATAGTVSKFFGTLFGMFTKLHWAVKAFVVVMGALGLGKLFGGGGGKDIEEMQKKLAATNEEIKKMTGNVKQLEQAEEGWRATLEDIKEENARIMSDQPLMSAYRENMKNMFTQVAGGTVFEQVGKEAKDAQKGIQDADKAFKEFNAELAKPKPGWFDKLKQEAREFIDILFGGGPKNQTVMSALEKNFKLTDINQFKDQVKGMEKDETIRMIRDYGLVGFILGQEGSKSAMQKGFVQTQHEFNQFEDQVLTPIKKKLVEDFNLGNLLGDWEHPEYRVNVKQFTQMLDMVNQIDEQQKKAVESSKKAAQAATTLDVDVYVKQMMKQAEDEVNGRTTVAEKMATLMANFRTQLQTIIGQNLGEDQRDARIRELMKTYQTDYARLLQMRGNPADELEKNAKLREQRTKEEYEFQIKQAENYQKITESNDNLAIAKLQATYDIFERITKSYYQEGLIAAETYFDERMKLMDLMLGADEARVTNSLNNEKKMLVQQGDLLRQQLSDAQKYANEASTGAATYKKSPELQKMFAQQIQKAGIEAKDVTNRIKELALKFDQFNAKTNAEKFELLKKRAQELTSMLLELRDAAGRIYEPFLKNAEILQSSNDAAKSYFDRMGNFKGMYDTLYQQQVLRNSMEEATIKNEMARYEWDLKFGALDAQGTKTATQAIELLKLKLYWTKLNNEELTKEAEMMKDPTGWNQFTLGVKESIRALGDFAKSMKDLGTDTVKGFQSAMESFFNDMLSGKSLKMTDYLKQWGDTMKASVAKMLSQQVTRGIGDLLGISQEKTDVQKMAEAQELARKATENLTASLQDQSGAFNILIERLTAVVDMLRAVMTEMMNIQGITPTNITGGVGNFSYADLQKSFGMKPSGAIGNLSYDDLRASFGLGATAAKPTAEAIASAIKTLESSGGVNQKTGLRGETGGYQWMPDTWARTSSAYAKEMGITGTLSQKDYEDAVAIWQIQKWLDQGYNPQQIASMWNAGPGRPNWEGNVGVKNGVAFDTPMYVSKFNEVYGQTASTTEKTFDDAKKNIADTNKEISLGTSLLDNMMGVVSKTGSTILNVFGGSRGIFNIFSDIFGGSSGSAAGSVSTYTTDANTPMFHSGGMIKRLHSGGLTGDEVPIIAQLGERMLSKSQNKQLTDVLMGRNIGTVAYGTNREQNAWYKTLLDAVSVRRQERTFDLPRRAATASNNSYEISVPVDVANSAPIRSPERFKADMREEMEKVALDVIRRHS